MRIDAIDILWYRADYDVPLQNGRYTLSGSNKVAWRLRTDDGVEGVAWTNGNALLLPFAEAMAQRVIGMDPFDVERIADVLDDQLAFGRGGRPARARSGIDIACWDIQGKVAGRSLHKLLGGHRDSIRAYVAGGYYAEGKSTAALADEALEEVSGGATAFKMKIGRLDVPGDLARVQAVRDALPDGVDLLIDSNGAYDRLTARRMARALGDLGVFWFEEPLDSADLDGLAELRATGIVPIALGERETHWHGFRRILQLRAGDVLNPDAQNLGGITAWRRVAALAAAEHVPVAPHGDQEIHLHLAAAVPNGFLVEYYGQVNRLRDAMLTEKLSLNPDGTLSPPDRPGLGVDLDEDAARPFEMARIEVR